MSVTKFEDFERIQSKIQSAIADEPVKDTISVLTSMIVIGLCVGLNDRGRAHAALDELCESMHRDIEKNHDDYVDDEAELVYRAKQ